MAASLTSYPVMSSGSWTPGLPSNPAEGPVSSELSGFAFLGPAVLAYYLADLLQGIYGAPRVDVAGLLSDVVAYVVMACLASAVLGAVMVLGRRRRPLGLAPRLAIPAYIAQSALHTYVNARDATTGPGPDRPRRQPGRRPSCGVNVDSSRAGNVHEGQALQQASTRRAIEHRAPTRPTARGSAVERCLKLPAAQADSSRQ